MILISKNIKDTEQIAEEFLFSIKNRDNASALVVGLYGELGAGKTHFVQSIGKLLGIKRKINSPTFVIMKSYKLPDVGCQNTQTSNVRKLVHIDAYRLKNEKELLHLGWAEIIKNPENIIFIEWPENVKKIMPKGHHKIKISHTKEGHRKFKIN